MESGSAFFQADERQDCTIMRFGTSARFFPRIIPPNADHFPPTLRLDFCRHAGGSGMFGRIHEERIEISRGDLSEK